MIKHLETHNALGEPIYYYTLTPEEVASLRFAHTEEQRRMDEWIRALQEGRDPREI